MTSAWKPPCRHAIPGGRHVWATAANYPRETDWWIQYWPFDHTRKQVSYIASKDQVVVCRFCLTQSSTPLVSLRYGWAPVPVACRSNKHSLQSELRTGESRVLLPVLGGVLLEYRLADSYLIRCCFFTHVTCLRSTVLRKPSTKFALLSTH